MPGDMFLSLSCNDGPAPALQNEANNPGTIKPGLVDSLGSNPVLMAVASVPTGFIVAR